MESKKILLSEEINKFKDKLAQNWFMNDNKFLYMKHKQNSKNRIQNRHKTKIIVNIRKEYNIQFLQELIDQGITTFKINGRTFNYKEYKKIFDDINCTYAKIKETPSIIFDLKGPETIITRIENTNHDKKFKKKQIVKISYENGCARHETENRIFIDKKISSLVDIGDIIEISDSSIILKVVSIERFNKRSNKFGSFLKILDEHPKINFQDKANLIRKFSLQDSENKPKIGKFNPLSSLVDNSSKMINEQKEFNSKLLKSQVLSVNLSNSGNHNFKSGEKNLINNLYDVENTESYSNLDNDSSSPFTKSKNFENTDKNKHCFKSYERREDDKNEYKCLYEEEESEVFNKKDDFYNIDLNTNPLKDELKEDVQEHKLGVIDEENSCEFELEDFLNKLNLNDDEEFPLDGKYFDNIYQDKLKTKKEKMDLIFQSIIKKQIKNKIEQNIPSVRSTELIDNRNFLRNARENYDLQEIEKIKYFDRKNRVKSSTSLDRISNKNYDIICEVEEEGSIMVNSGFSIRDKEINSRSDTSILSAKDIIDINKCLSLGINNLSFTINNLKNIEEINDILSDEQLSDVKIFARLETQESLINFDSILKEVDGIVLNHGFKFYNFQYKDLYLIEIYIIEKCKQYNKPLILQTNNIKSINVNKPAIFKVSILDFAVKAGIDGIIIKDELCEMQEYLNIVRASRNVLIEIERVEDSIHKYFDESNYFCLNQNLNCVSMKERIIMSLLDNAVKLSHELNAELIILFTDQIQFAKIITNLRPPCIIACPTASLISYRFLRLFRGVIPYIYEEPISVQDLLDKLIGKFRDKNIINKVVKSILIRAYLNKRSNEINNEIDNYNNGIFCYDF